MPARQTRLKLLAQQIRLSSPCSQTNAQNGSADALVFIVTSLRLNSTLAIVQYDFTADQLQRNAYGGSD